MIMASIRCRLVCYLFFLFLSLSSTLGSSTTAMIMFAFRKSINTTFLDNAVAELKKEQFPSSILLTNFTFANFPRFPLYTTRPEWMQHKPYIEGNNTLFIIGEKDYYADLLTRNGIKTKFSGYNVRLIPIFNFHVSLYLKILGKLYDKYIGTESMTIRPNTLVVLDGVYVDSEKPWINVNVLKSIFFDANTNLRFLYYKNNPNDITAKILANNINNILLMIDSNSAQAILSSAFASNLFNWRFRWIIILPISSTLNIRHIGFDTASKNVTVVQFGDSDVNSTFPLDTSINTAAFDSLRISFYLTRYLLTNKTTVVPATSIWKTGNFSINYANLKYFDLPPVTRQSWVMQVFQGLGKDTKLVGNIIGMGDGSHESGGSSTIDYTNLPPKETMKMTNEEMRAMLLKRTFRVATIIDPPFIMWKQNKSAYKNVEDQLEGFVFDVAKAILKFENISYSITVLPTPFVGNKQPNGEWNGLMKEIMHGRYDLGVAAISITNERAQVVDFLEYFDGYKGAILFKENVAEGVKAMFQFLLPIDLKAWGLLIGSIVVVTVVLAILHCISPNKTNYNLYESFFFALGSIFQGVTINPPDRASGRILVSFWWFFSLVIIIVYITNYGVYRTQMRTRSSISSLNNLLNQYHYEYGTVKNTHYDQLFRDSNLEFMQKLNKIMRQEFQHGLMPNTTEALKYVRQGSYAFIWDNSITRYYAYTQCLKSTGEFDQYRYGFIVPKLTDYKPLLNTAILSIRETNVLRNLKAKYPYLDGTTKNPVCEFSGFFGFIKKSIPEILKQYSSSSSMTLEQTLGIFIIMVTGCTLSLILALIECVFRRFYQRRYDKKRKEQMYVERQKTERKILDPESFA